MQRIIVLGGGAGGLELVVKLGRKLGRRREAEVILVDKNPTHIWKPLFHEVATGSMNSYHDEAAYQMLARKHGFKFVLGRATSIDLNERNIELAPIKADGVQMVPVRTLSYDTLIVAVGSQSNDFGIAGVKEFSRQLDSREEAEQFHKIFTAQMHRVNAENAPELQQLNVVIVGGGATGVELAADMHNVVQRLSEYGFERFSKDRLKVRLIEAADELLPRLPIRIGTAVHRELGKIGIDVRTGTMVAKVEKKAVITSEDESIPADISVWAAGVKAPQWIADSGFSVDRLGRIEVNDDLSVQGLDGVYALGDCCACKDRHGKDIPPRAQAAHQMADIVARNVIAARRGREARPFIYRDFGSLISLSKYSTVGNLMGNLMRGSVFVEGWMARMFYLSLYRMHQSAVHGLFSTFLIMLGDRIYKATRAEVKLH
ncbi:MAG: NAD(P)/FAD-dependent oxidoreductase [Pseudomonadota bacterium]